MARETEKPIRTAVVGLGRAGWGIHVAAIRGRKDYVLTEVVDSRKERLAEAQAEFGCPVYEDYRKFIRETKAELIVIATQSRDHARQALSALNAGKHVLVEKPVATNLSDVDKLIKAAAVNKRILTVHQSARLDPGYVQIQEIIRSGLLGRLFFIRRGLYEFARRNDWQVLSKYGGGQLNNTGVHLIDQALGLLDTPVKDVWGDLQQILNPGDVEDHVKVVVRAESGLGLDIEVTTACALPLPSWVLMGERGSLVSDGTTVKLRYTASKRLPKLKPVDDTAAVGRRYGTGEHIKFVEKQFPAGAKKVPSFYDSLYESIRKGKPLLVTPESVRQTMQVLQRARKGTLFAR